MALVSMAEYAGLHGVSKPAVTKWKKRGLLVFKGKLVNVEASDAMLIKHRVAHTEPVNGKVNEPVNAPVALGAADVPALGMDESIEQAAEQYIAQHGANLPMEEAKRKKENYLALLNQLKYEQESGNLVPLVQAETILFEEARRWRDVWLSFSTNVAPLIAADLGIEADRIIEVLTPHVHKQVAALGEPEGDFKA